MNLLIKNAFRFTLFLLFQVYVLDKILLHHLITPYIYFTFILWLPFKMNRALQMLIAFILGFALDSFRHNPGFHAAACVMIAYFRPFLINLLIPQEGTETNYDEPSLQSMGGLLPYFVYVGLLSLLHSAWLFLLEAWQFGNIWYFLLKTFFSAVISVLLILLTELIFSRKQKFRTNTA